MSRMVPGYFILFTIFLEFRRFTKLYSIRIFRPFTILCVILALSQQRATAPPLILESGPLGA